MMHDLKDDPVDKSREIYKHLQISTEHLSKTKEILVAHGLSPENPRLVLTLKPALSGSVGQGQQSQTLFATQESSNAIS